MSIRREILLIIVLIFVIALLVKVVEFFRTDVVEADASNFVLEDLKSKYPDADLEIMSITNKYNPLGSHYFEVKARVTEGAETACPERSHIFYNYPAQNFIAQPTEAITRNCNVCTEGICTIAFSEEAIIASHKLSGTYVIQAYLNVYPDAVPTISEKAESWIVKWDSKTAQNYYLVEIHRNGTIMQVKDLNKNGTAVAN